MSGLQISSTSPEKQIKSRRQHFQAAENHIARKVGPEVQARIDALKIGQKMQDLPEELWHESFRYYLKEDPNRKGGPNMRIIRLDPRKPSLTVTAYIFNKFVHPTENRYITVREAARLQGFPDDLIFYGTLTSTQLQVGNAVPVPLGKAIFQAVLAYAYKQGLANKDLTAMSLFSGAGGLDIGADQAEYKGYKIRTLLASDIWEDAVSTLSGWYGSRCSVVLSDIQQLDDPIGFWQKYSNHDTLPDILYGGPPCQAFSQCGRQKHINDPRGQLIGEYLRIIEKMQPRFFILENVSNLRGVGGGKLYQEIQDSIEDIGYTVNVNLLNAADYGAPQKRRRVFFLGVRGNYPPIPIPDPTHGEQPTLFSNQIWVGVGDAFKDLPEARFKGDA
ncbi:MAG: DNA (cytosine-5-)-methyltransferase [Cyanothece sp. SIO2G6]|nr:DNA (cytosine-5-)-methyltransferase [Cyanothece sp. SIO2G6]